ncbi:MAG: hypothetical protein JO270_11430 [Acidobacteriaceae bacterium]|nr:hypothetical protein [Acidobacteriaceae bacterium]MBV8571796.1 hypothetical protein [Acidobacteriaceae bacterium]
MKRALGILLFAAILHPALSSAKSKRLIAIDAYCTQIRDEFRETVPLAFAGPDPWVEIDDIGAALSDDTIAYVYADGPRIRWVVLMMSGSKQNWNQTVDYYFRDDGTIAKRERLLDSAAANIELQEVSYYENGRPVKEFTHHHALGPGREDSSRLDDPDAPVYMSVQDLPFPNTPDYWRQLAGLPCLAGPGIRAKLAERLIDVPNQVFGILKSN